MATLSIPHNPDETQSGDGRWGDGIWNAKNYWAVLNGYKGPNMV